ncbi:hypothetical protein BRC83_01055 [Halobacteriales archaeon QS_1_68_17]|jgi:hypothetical protein|nr:MAG: hypothetical protein BRC83_01055 [Halobacteriales archaeon QS_1_68_17]
MLPLQLGPLASAPGILGTLLVLALILLVGRFLLSLAWRLLLIGIVVVVVLWLLGVLGFGFGILWAGLPV